MVECYKRLDQAERFEYSISSTAMVTPFITLKILKIRKKIAVERGNMME